MSHTRVPKYKEKQGVQEVVVTVMFGFRRPISKKNVVVERTRPLGNSAEVLLCLAFAMSAQLQRSFLLV